MKFFTVSNELLNDGRGNIIGKVRHDLPSAVKRVIVVFERIGMKELEIPQSAEFPLEMRDKPVIHFDGQNPLRHVLKYPRKMTEARPDLEDLVTTVQRARRRRSC